MNIPYDHECFNWVWKIGEEAADSFIFKYVGDQFGYCYSNEQERFYYWGISKERLEDHLMNWYKEKPIDFHGPMQPTPSKVILKIRQMEARQSWKSLQS